MPEYGKKLQLKPDLQVVLMRNRKQTDPNGYEDNKNKISTITIYYQEL